MPPKPLTKFLSISIQYVLGNNTTLILPDIGQEPTFIMRKDKYRRGNPQLRQLLVRESARLMYEDGVVQYFDAKNLAAKKILGRGQKGSVSVRTTDLPSNGEISEEIHKLAQFYEGDNLHNRLFDMRVTGRSSTDGKPIVRISADSLMHILFNEHEESWNAHLQNIPSD